MQSVKSPSIIQSVKSVINNRPLLLITLSDFLSGFAIKGSEDDYYTDVLHFSSMTLVAGIPAAPISPLSYSWVPWMRARFSSRTLYILAKEIGNINGFNVWFNERGFYFYWNEETEFLIESWLTFPAYPYGWFK